MTSEPSQARFELVELSRASASALNRLLEIETEEWAKRLKWDFHTSAELIRRFVQLRVLQGYLAAVNYRTVGYCYCVLEGSKALIGDLYVLPAYRRLALEQKLLAATVSLASSEARIRRIEAQLPLQGQAIPVRIPPSWEVRQFWRHFMLAPLDHVHRLPQHNHAKQQYRIEPWFAPYHQRVAAEIVAIAYRDHIDSEINDQYCSLEGAEHFIRNVVQYPGCGRFLASASFLAFDRESQAACGLCLATLVAAGVGHIAQVCVVPSHRGRGVGYELLRRSMVALAEQGCFAVTLTVTESNQKAIQLYRNCGFGTIQRFPAYVWQRRSQ